MFMSKGDFNQVNSNFQSITSIRRAYHQRVNENLFELCRVVTELDKDRLGWWLMPFWANVSGT